MAKAKEKEPGFEESLGSLEKIVAQLESGDLPLERALAIFEDGVGLARRCQTQLEDAERKVEVLLRERGEIKTAPFDSKFDTAFSETERLGTLIHASSPLASSTQTADSDAAADTDDIIPF